MTEPRVIKRYANRKLYDTQRSRYVTLDQIAEMIRSGEDVKIIDNNSKEDLTTITLAQIIFEEEKKQKSFLPLNAMRNIIQSGGERIEELVSQAQKRVSGVFGRKHPDKPEGEGPPVEGDNSNSNSNSEHKEGTRALRDWLDASQQKLNDWQKTVDERVRHLIDGLSPFASLSKEVNALATRIGELEKRLEKLEKPDG
jgi:polyhydroxyalkanoate synthesis repressor PhaR